MGFTCGIVSCRACRHLCHNGCLTSISQLNLLTLIIDNKNTRYDAISCLICFTIMRVKSVFSIVIGRSLFVLLTVLAIVLYIISIPASVYRFNISKPFLDKQQNLKHIWSYFSKVFLIFNFILFFSSFFFQIFFSYSYIYIIVLTITQNIERKIKKNEWFKLEYKKKNRLWIYAHCINY